MACRQKTASAASLPRLFLIEREKKKCTAPYEKISPIRKKKIGWKKKSTQDHGDNLLVRALDICTIHNMHPLPFPVANKALFLRNHLYLQSSGCRRRASIGQKCTGRPEGDENGNVSPVQSVQEEEDDLSADPEEKLGRRHRSLWRAGRSQCRWRWRQ